MKILGIETSCDETAAAVVENGKKTVSNIVSSSQELHKKTGGIIPEIAAREQIRCIIPVINEALKVSKNGNNNKLDSSIKSLKSFIIKEIDAIAVTVGPGLIGSLLIGVETAKTIAYVTGKPIVPVNHIFAHSYANWLAFDEKPKFPAIVLVVSGGHTELFLYKDHGKIKWLGGTRDDAAGETFDKTARLLELGYPGGPAIAAAAAIINNNINIKLPRPMIDEDNLDFSFSGLKTATLREINKLKTLRQFNNLTIKQLAYEIQESITDVLVNKTLKAAKQYNVQSILLGGGVAANQRLKEKFELRIENCKLKIYLFIPPPSICTDNAAYVASFAYYNYHPIPWQKIQAQPGLEIEV